MQPQLLTENIVTQPPRPVKAAADAPRFLAVLIGDGEIISTADVTERELGRMNRHLAHENLPADWEWIRAADVRTMFCTAPRGTTEHHVKLINRHETITLDRYSYNQLVDLAGMLWDCSAGAYFPSPTGCNCYPCTTMRGRCVKGGK